MTLLGCLMPQSVAGLHGKHQVFPLAHVYISFLRSTSPLRGGIGAQHERDVQLCSDRLQRRWCPTQAAAAVSGRLLLSGLGANSAAPLTSSAATDMARVFFSNQRGAALQSVSIN